MDMHKHIRRLTDDVIRKEFSARLFMTSDRVCLNLAGALQIMHEFVQAPCQRETTEWISTTMSTYGEPSSALHLAARCFMILAHPVNIDHDFAMEQVSMYVCSNTSDPLTVPFEDMAHFLSALFVALIWIMDHDESALYDLCPMQHLDIPRSQVSPTPHSLLATHPLECRCKLPSIPTTTGPLSQDSQAHPL